jgi:hypothetical protein
MPNTPGISREDELRDFIIREVEDNRAYQQPRITEVGEYTKRYEAKRSISGLLGWGDDPRKRPKDSPWEGACYSSDTEVLTKRGWILVKDVTTSDLVYSMNPLTKESWWMPVMKKQVYPFEQMIHFQGKSIDLLVSHNHKMLVVNKNFYSNVEYPHCDSLPAKFIRADDLLNKKHLNYSIPLVSNFSQSENITQIYGFKAEDWLDFLGWYISEGYTHKNSGTIGICQSEEANPEKCNELKDLFKRMNLRYSFDGKQFMIWVKKTGRGNNCIVNEAREELKNLGLCNKKYIPRKYLDLEPALLNILLSALIKGDGNIFHKQNGKTKKMYYTTSKELADNIQEIVQKIGLRASLYQRNCIGKGGIIRGRKIASRHISYAININNKVTIQLSKLRITSIQYNDLAYCVTTPFHTLYVRRNGKAIWCGNSDVGIPIDAFTIEGLLPRFLKVCYGSKPIVWIRGTGQSDIPNAPIVQEALNYQLTRLIKVYRRMKLIFKTVTIDGDAFAKCVWEKKTRPFNRVVNYLQNPLTGEFVRNQENGQPVEVKSDFVPQPLDGFGTMPVMIKDEIQEEKVVYEGPMIYGRTIKEIIIPKNAISPEIEEWDWICDTYDVTFDWLARREGDIKEGKFKNVNKIYDDVIAKSSDHNKAMRERINIYEWYGKYDINGDDKDEEIIAFVCSKYKVLLGWMLSPFAIRPFFHYQIIPMEGKPFGKGVPEFLIGMRDMIDAVFNQMIDRGSINNNPPIITPTDHEEELNPFGPGVKWKSDDPAGYRVLELPKSEQIEFAKLNFLLGMVQKLFGVMDYAVADTGGLASNRTATGIMSVIGEGNIKFDDMIRALQDVNEDLYNFIVLLNSDNLDDNFIYQLTEQQENPFKTINKSYWGGNYDYEAAGNSININRQIAQNNALLSYNTALNSYGKNPAIGEETMVDVTQNFFSEIDIRNVRLKPIEQIKQEKEQALAMQQRALQMQMQTQQVKTGGVGV